MRKLIVLVVLSLAGVGLPAATSGASAVAGLACGQTITASVRMTHDLTCAQGFAVIDLAGGPPVPITIDLGGHALRLTSPSGQVSCGLLGRGSCVISSLSGVDLTVKDGTVVGPVGESGGGLVIAHVHVEGNVLLDDTTAGVDDSLRSSWVDGFVVLGSGTDQVTHDVIRGGIDADNDISSLQVTITDNLITGDPSEGIVFQGGAEEPAVSGVIAANVISHSAGSGISLPGDNLDGLLIARNRLVANGGDGITIGPPSMATGATATITRNVADDNAGHGIDVSGVAGDTFADGGHNTATGNSTAPQCLGVTCVR